MNISKSFNQYKKNIIKLHFPCANSYQMDTYLYLKNTLSFKELNFATNIL